MSIQFLPTTAPVCLLQGQRSTPTTGSPTDRLCIIWLSLSTQRTHLNTSGRSDGNGRTGKRPLRGTWPCITTNLQQSQWLLSTPTGWRHHLPRQRSTTRVGRRHAWPILSKLALNISSTPAMSAEPERVFSDGSELITGKRNGLGDDTVEAEMIQNNDDLEGIAGSGCLKGRFVRMT